MHRQSRFAATQSTLTTTTNRHAAARLAAATLLTATALLLPARTASAATNVTWTGATSNNMDVTTNWSPAQVPSGSAGDTAIFNGTATGPQSLTYTGVGNGLTQSGGITLSVAAGQTSPLTINEASGTAGLRLQGLTIASGAGAFTFGGDGTTDAITLGSNTAFTFTNNSANTATVGNDVVFAFTSGTTTKTLTLAGSGNWNFGGRFGAGGTGALASFIVAPSATSTVTVTNNIVGTNSSGNPAPANVFVKSGTLVWGTGAAVATRDFSSIGQNGTDVGTLTMQGSGTFTSGSDFNVGDVGSSQGTLNVQDSATLTAAGLFVASANAASSTARGTVNQSGGTVSVTRTADGNFIVGGRSSAAGNAGTGTYNLSGGTLNNAGNAWIGGYGAGTVNQTGGTFNNTAWLSIGRQAGSTGVFNISAGTLNQTGAGTEIIVGEAGTGTLNVSSTASVNTNTALRITNSATGVGTVNLDGGTLSTPVVKSAGGSSTFNFNGGTLRTTTNNASFMTGLTAANVRNGGAVIQADNDVTIAQPLLHSPIAGDNAADGGLTKNGGGTLTLAGASTYTGPTSVNAGGLAITGSVPNTSAVTVADFATLSTKLTGPTASVLTTPSLTLGSGDGANLSFDFNNLSAPTAPFVSAGAFTATGFTNVTINGAALLSSGTYKLVSYSTFAGGGSFPTDTYTFTPRTSGTVVNDGTSALSLVVSANLPVWSGLDSSSWVVGTTGASGNWKLQTGGASTDYIEGDAVIFDDSAAGTTTVDISAANVSPVSVVFNNNAKTYTFTTSTSSGIAGTGLMIKNGSGAVTLASNNSYSGGTTLNAGTLNLDSPTALGTGPLVVNGGSLDNTLGSPLAMTANNPQTWNADVTFLGSSSLDMGAGVVTLPGTGSPRTVNVANNTLAVGQIVGVSQGLTKTGAGTLAINTTAASSINGTLTVAAGTLQINTGADAAHTGDFIATGLTGSGTVTNGGGVERWLILNTPSSNTFAGTLTNGGSGALGLQKLGTGSLTLTGANSYSGTTTLNNGTLIAANPAALGNTARLNVSAPAGTTPSYVVATDGSDPTLAIGMGSGTTWTYVSDRATPGPAVNRSLSVLPTAGIGNGVINFTAGPNVTSGTPNISFASFGLGAGGSGTTLLNPTNVTLSIGDVSKFNNTPAQTLGLDGTTSGNLVTGTISNGTATAVSVTKSNSSAWTLSGNNTYTGTTTVNAGSLVMSGNNSLGAGAITVNGGTLTLSGSNSYTGTTTLAGGSLVVANPSALGSTARVNVSADSPTLLFATDSDTPAATPIGMSSGATPTIVSDRATPGPAVDRTLTVPSSIGGLGTGTLNFTAGPNVTSGTPKITFTTLGLGAGAGGTTTLNPVGVTLSIGDVSKFNNNPNQTLGLDGTSAGNAVTGVISNILAGGANTAVVSLNKSNSSTWTLSGANTFTGLTTVAGGTLVLQPNAWNAAETLGGLDIKAAPNTSAIFDYTGTSSPAASVKSAITAGKILSSTTDHGVVVADNLVSEVTLTSAYFGDLNLDNAVNADDFALIDRAAALGLGGSWSVGDFNYDGVVDAADYLKMDTAYGHLTGTLSPSLLAERSAQFGPDYVAALTAAVPEPTTLFAACGFALPALLKRTRRRTTR